MSAQLSRCVAEYSRHFVPSRINAPAVVFVFTLDHFVTAQRTVGWTKSLLDCAATCCGCTWPYRRHVGIVTHAVCLNEQVRAYASHRVLHLLAVAL